MTDTDNHLDELAGRLADREQVDWEESIQEATSESDAELVEAMRVISEISEAHGRLAAQSELLPAGHRWGTLEIDTKLGEGSFAEVYRARDVNLDRVVALKLLRPMRQPALEGSGLRTDGPSDEAEVLTEGRLLARIKHPHVATVYGANLHQGRVGLWMELIEGQTLKQIVEKGGPLGCREATLIGLDLARALGAVHHQGILHRDVKAQNVMRESGGRTVLMDFGIGRDLDNKKRESVITGTPLYLAPELLSGEAATPRSDLYSLGVLLFYLVSGQFPIRADSLEGLREAHRSGKRASLRDLRPGLPEPFLTMVDRCLADKPRKRFESMGELEASLVSLLAIDESTGEIPIPLRPSHRRLAIPLAATAAVLLLVLGALAWFNQKRQDRSSVPPTQEGSLQQETEQLENRAAVLAATRLRDSPCVRSSTWEPALQNGVHVELAPPSGDDPGCTQGLAGSWRFEMSLQHENELNLRAYPPGDILVRPLDEWIDAGVGGAPGG